MADAGISVFLLSLPFGRERDFYYKELRENIFRRYREAVERKFGTKGVAASEFSGSFYKPSAYCLFGRFDLAVISLVDDFEFSSRTFHPFDPMMAPDFEGQARKPYFENFLHKVITGPTPSFSTEPGEGLVGLAKRTFLAEYSKPLFAVSLLKLNNSLLIGCGSALLRQAVLRIKELSSHYSGLDVIILESYSWHEITLLVFGSSYRDITRFTTDVKESQLSQLGGEALALCNAQSLLAARERHRSGWRGCGEAHVFADSDTVLGFDFRIFDKDKDKREKPLARVDKTDEIEILSRWFIKPGHLGKARAVLVENHETRLAFGRGDLLANPMTMDEQGQRKPLTNTADCLRVFVDASCDSRLAGHVLQRHTTMLAAARPDLEEVPEDHICFTDSLKQLHFTIQQLAAIEDGLRKRGTPKILALKVLNMYANFNDGLLDRNLYGFFAELLPFMLDLDAAVRSEHVLAPDTTQWSWMLQRRLENFELAYRNRFYNSHRLGEVADFNVDFKGGIQQLVSAFDAAYKAIASAVGDDHSFVSVTGEPAVFSTPFETRLNYFHVFQPEAFLTVALHEAAWCCFNGEPRRVHGEARSLLDQLKGEAPAVSEVFRVTWRSWMKSGVVVPHNRPPEVDLKFLHAVVLDRLSLCLTYNRDADLLWYWYWGYYAQIPTAYHQPLVPSGGRGLEFLLRLCLVCDADTEDRIESLLSPFRQSPFGELWNRVKSPLLDTLQELRSDQTFSQWRANAWRLADYRSASAWQPCLAPTGLGPSTQSVSAEVSKRADAVALSLAEGCVVPFTHDGDFATFRYCQVLFFGYLRFLKAHFGADNRASILRRNADTKKAEPRSDGESFLFDPFGGIFTLDAQLRRDYFKYRSALTMSLWDMALKTKREPILERFVAAERPTPVNVLPT